VIFRQPIICKKFRCAGMDTPIVWVVQRAFGDQYKATDFNLRKGQVNTENSSRGPDKKESSARFSTRHGRPGVLWRCYLINPSSTLPAASG